jgi:3-oxoacyl-(acyl-carrier-protein) synthase
MNFIDHHKWLVDNNLLTEEIKNNIAMAAYCIVEDVVDAQTRMDFNDNIVHYKLVIADELFNNIKLLEKYEKTGEMGFFEMRRLKKFLQVKKDNDELGLGYKLETIANKFVKSYLNNKWSATVTIVSDKDYDASKDPWLHSQGDSTPN